MPEIARHRAQIAHEPADFATGRLQIEHRRRLLLAAIFSLITLIVGACTDGGAGQGADASPGSDDAAMQVAVCGNGIVEAPESCDTAITPGATGACPTSCDDGLSCTGDVLEGTGCSAYCSFDEVTSCSDGDGCCPSSLRCHQRRRLFSDLRQRRRRTAREMRYDDRGRRSRCVARPVAMTASPVRPTRWSALAAPAECSYTAILSCADGDGCCPGRLQQRLRQ